MTLTQSYLFLGLAIVVEVIGTTALKATDNFTRLWPSLLTIVCYAASFYLLTFSLRVLPCLDAVDVFTRFPNTTLARSPSSADSTYMEVRHQDLPSGLSKAVLPNKVYHPKLPVLDVAWSTATLLKTVEDDLARR